MNARVLELALRIADDAARGVVLVETVPLGGSEGWIDLASGSPEGRTHMAEAVEYLELRGLLEHKAGTANVVRFRNPSLLN